MRVAYPTWMVAALFCGAGFSAPTLQAREHEHGGISVLEQTGSAFTAIAKEATPAVVFIKAERTVSMGGRPGGFRYNDPFGFFGDDFLRRFFDRRGFEPPSGTPRQFRQMGQGSGFIINEDGYILTNHHVVGDADKITVKLQDGREFDAERIGSDPKSEVALIRIQGDDLPHLELGDSSKIQVGEWVVAIGNPFGLDATVTAGVISAVGRSNIGIADYEDFIQTDAAINPGNSGGPLLNIRGEVIGINTAIYSRSGGYMGIGFAIPIDMAVAIQDQLVKSGKVTRGFLGILIQDMTRDLAESFGLEDAEGILIADVTEDSPAGKAGLEAGDVILELNGNPTRSVGEFRNEIASNPPGTEVALTVVRDGKQQTIEVTTGEMPDEEQAVASSEQVTEQLGLTVQDLTAETAARLGLPMEEGVLVSNVERGSIAGQAGLQPGNIITSVNQRPVTTAEDFLKAVAGVGDDGLLLLRVRDRGFSRYVTLRLP